MKKHYTKWGVLFLLTAFLVGGDFKRDVPSRAFSPDQLSGITMWLDASDLDSLTVDAQRRVSQWDSRVGSISFTQAVDGNKPVRTVGSQGENRFTYSEAFNNAFWTVSATSIDPDSTTGPGGASTADTLIENGATTSHALYSDVYTYIQNEKYHVSVYAKQASGDRNIAVQLYEGASFRPAALCDLSDGSTDTALINPVGDAEVIQEDVGSGWYRCTLAVTFTPTTQAENVYLYLTDGLSFSYAGDTTSGVYLSGAQLRHANTSPAYVATGDHAIYAGSPTGLSGVKFDGVDDHLASTATLGDIVDADAKTLFLVFRTEDIVSLGGLLYDQGGYIGTRTDTSVLRVRNYDGTSDDVTTTVVASQLHVAEYYHDGTNQTVWLDGSGKNTGASGNTSSVGSALSLGDLVAGGIPSSATLSSVIAYDKVLSSAERANVRQYLCNKWGASC